MAEKTPIASIASITGKAYARDAQGNVREVFEGELLYQGEVLITSAGGSVDLATIDGDFVTIADATETTMTTDLVASLAAGNDESELTDESIDEITNLLAGDGDILEGLEATAAGVAGGGGEQEGHSFIRLGRIVEELNPLGLAIPSDSRAIQEEETTGLNQDVPPPAPTPPGITATPGSASEEGFATGLPDTSGTPDTTNSVTASGKVTATDAVSYTLQAPTIALQSGGANVIWNGSGTDTLTGIAAGAPVATITIDSSGNYTFTLLAPIDHPAAGEDSVSLDFTASATDSAGNELNTPLIIGIEDDAPLAADDVIPTTASDTPVTFDVRGNDKAGGDGPDTGTLVVDNFAQPGNGSVALNADGTFTYTPNAGFSGSDSFTYQIKDADGDISEATVSLSVAANPPPTLEGAAGRVSEEGLADGLIDNDPNATADTTNDPSVTGNVLASDPNGDVLTYSLTAPTTVVQSGGFDVTWTPNGDNTALTGSANGVNVATISITPNATGASYTFTVLQPFDHAAAGEDVLTLDFGVSVSDGANPAVPATISIGIEDDAPLAANDTVPQSEFDTPVTFDVRGNDKAGGDGPDTGTLVVDNFAQPGNGSVALNADGTFTYTPNAGFSGSDSFTYQIKDADGDISEATVSLSVAANPPPTLEGAAGRVSEEGLADGLIDNDPNATADTTNDPSVTGNVLASDPNGDVLTYSLTAPTTVVQSGGFDVTWTPNGDNTALTGSANGVNVATISITPNATGASYTFTVLQPFDHAAAGEDVLTLDFGVSVSDGANPAVPATISIGIEDDAPLAANDTVPQSEFDTPVTFDVRGNDKAGGDGPDTGTLVVDNFAQPGNGSVALNADGTFTYTPNAGFSGSDSFTYQIKDADGDISQATVSLSVNGDPEVVGAAGRVSEEGLTGGLIDNDPNATDDTTNETSVSGNVLASDPEGDALTYSLTAPTTAVQSGGSDVTWTPNADSTALTGSANGVNVATISIDADGKYTFDLLKPFDHAAAGEDVLTLDFGVSVSDGTNPAVPATISIGIEDDAPLTRNVFQESPAEPETHNLVFVLDRSESMGSGQGYELTRPDGSTITKMEILKATITNFMNTYDDAATLNIQLVSFARNTTESDWFTNSDLGPGGAIETWMNNNLTPSGGTSYRQVLESVRTDFSQPDADKSLVYFVSDGFPVDDLEDQSRRSETDYRNDADNYEVGQAAWEAFLDANGFDAAYSAGIGVTVDQGFGDLELGVMTDILSLVSHIGVNSPLNTSTDNPPVAQDATIYVGSGLASDPDPAGNFLATISATIDIDNITGNLFANSAIEPGADGAVITTVNVGGTDYTIADATDVGGEFVLTALTAGPDAGAFMLNFTTGDYGFVAPEGVPKQETFAFKVVDGDGDEATFTLNIRTGSDPGATVSGTGADEIILGSTFGDTLVGGGGDDIITGGLGADVFAWELGDQGTAGSPAIDTVTDFNAGEGDVLDLSDLLQNAAPTDDLGDYIFIESDGTNSTVHISSTGGLTGDASNADQSIVFEGVDLVAGAPDQSTIINDLISTGKLVTDV